jgi:hypothetical protein
VLLVGHGALNCSLINQLEHIPLERFWEKSHGNCELEKIEWHGEHFRETSKRDILFEYKSTSSFGFFGMPDGKSIIVYSDGLIMHRSFVLGKDEPATEDRVAFVPEAAVLIKKVLIAHKGDLEKISSNLNNGTLDGSHDCFQFGKKKISSWTITRTDISEVRQKNPEYYVKHMENMVQENMVLDIYNEIIDILNEYKVGLNLKKR